MKIISRNIPAFKLIPAMLLTAQLLFAAPRLVAGEPAAADWPEYHRTANGWRNSPLNQINTANVSRLKVAWIHQAGDIAGGLAATPIVQDGIIYYISAYNRVQAIDGASGRELWRYQPKLDPKVEQIAFAPYSRGLAVARGKVFLATLDGRGIALDQATGKELWQVQLTDFANCQGCNFTSPPVQAGDVLVFGSTGGDLATASRIYAVSIDDGRRLWTFDIIKNDPQSWPEGAAKVGGGGAWMTGQYDAETDTVFYGTGNAAATLYGADRPGDNLYTASIIALDPKTGALRWHHQETPHDVYDYDSTFEFVFFQRDGRPLLSHLSKNGFVTVLDRRDGKVINVWPLPSTINWTSGPDPKTWQFRDQVPIEAGKTYHICPTVNWGGRSWNHGSYSPDTGLWYTAVIEACTNFEVAKPAPPDPHGMSYSGYKRAENVAVPGKAPGRIDAVDPVTGQRKWSRDFSFPPTACFLTTAGGLLFEGGPEGLVRAHDLRDGRELWSFNTGTGLRAGIVTYSVKGRQYILVPAGWGSWPAMLFPQMFPELARINGAASLIAFSLDNPP